MFRNYLKITIRNLGRQKLFSFINIFGLGLSMSICLLVLLRIKDQVSYDNFHPHAKRTYRITTDITTKEGNHIAFATSPLPLAKTLVQDYSIVESYARLYPLTGHKATAGKKELAIRTAFTDEGFFNLFGFTLESGDATTVFNDPNSIILSKEMAQKYFGSRNAMGEFISFAGLGDFRVAGVLNNPGKSHIDFDAYISIAALPVLEKSGKLAANSGDWNYGTIAYTYVLLNEKNTKQQLSKALATISDRLIKQSHLQGKENFAFSTQRLDKIVLGQEMQYSLGNTGSRSKVITEIVIAFIILLSACFNYTNLSVARSLNRGKEVGIRKVSGAVRLQIFTQFVVESLVISLLSLIVGFVILRLIIDYAPFMAELIPANAVIDGSLWIWFILFSLFTGLLAGALPAWILSSFKPVEVLKNLSNIKLFGNNGFRKSLIVAQFALSLVVTIFTLTFSKQFNYMATADPGFNREDIITIPLQGKDYTLLANDIAQLNGVIRVAATSGNPGRGATGVTLIKAAAGKEPVRVDYFSVDQNFIYNLDLSLLAGNTFPPDVNKDHEQYVLITKKALDILQVKDASEAIGKMVTIDDSVQVQVAGVISDFYYQGLEMPYQPLLLRYRPQDFRFMNIKISADQPAAVAAAIERVWNKHLPKEAFAWGMLKEELYARQRAWSTVSMLGFLAFMAIVIACLGLLGMAIYTTETRRREISIRKVLGAGTAGIIGLLSKNFLKLVIIAGLIAIPVSYVSGFLFLNIFANRISIGIGLPLLCFAGILLLALVTTGTQIYRVATSNPVDSLKND